MSRTLSLEETVGREQQIMKLYAKGFSGQQVADELKINLRTLARVQRIIIKSNHYVVGCPDGVYGGCERDRQAIEEKIRRFWPKGLPGAPRPLSLNKSKDPEYIPSFIMEGKTKPRRGRQPRKPLNND